MKAKPVAIGLSLVLMVTIFSFVVSPLAAKGINLSSFLPLEFSLTSLSSPPVDGISPPVNGESPPVSDVSPPVYAHDVGIVRMEAPHKVKVNGKIIARRIVITAESYEMVEPNAVVWLYARYPNGLVLSWSKNVLLEPGRGATRVEFEVNLDASRGLGHITWWSWVYIPYPEPYPDPHPNMGGPVQTIIWSK